MVRQTALRPEAVTDEGPDQRGTRGLRPLGRHAPAVSVLGHAEHLARGRGWLGRLGYTKTEVFEDLPDGHLVG
jgi:hypothetical protein